MKDVENLKQVKQVVDVSFHDVLFSTEDPSLLDGPDDVDDHNQQQQQQLQPLAGAKCAHDQCASQMVCYLFHNLLHTTCCCPCRPLSLPSAHPLLTSPFLSSPLSIPLRGPASAVQRQAAILAPKDPRWKATAAGPGAG